MHGATKYDHKGRYVNFKVVPRGDLLINLTPEGAEELKELLDAQKGEDEIFFALAEDIICNSPYMNPTTEQAGFALTEAPIISWEAGVGDNGEWEENSDTQYWYFPDYQIVSFIEVLDRDGIVVFPPVTPVVNF